MTTGAANAGVSELARQMFDLAAVAYRAEPTEPNFAALFARKPDPDDKASVSEVVYSVARPLGYRVPTVAHLAKVLATEHRVHEAQFYCDAWIEEAPTDVEAHRLAALIACEAADLPRAQIALRNLETHSAAPATLLAIRGALLATFTDGRLAIDILHEAIATSARDTLATMVAVDVALRRSDPSLLAAAYVADPGVFHPPHEPRAKAVLREGIVHLLKLRPECPPIP